MLGWVEFLILLLILWLNFNFFFNFRETNFILFIFLDIAYNYVELGKGLSFSL